LLVSVRDAWEAEEALAGGADWIDLKEPRRGPLGAVTADVAREVACCIGARAPLSAAAGELADWATASSRELLHVPGIAHLKLGLANCSGQPWESWWRAAQKEAAATGKDLVASAYVDHSAARAPDPVDVAGCAASAGATWLLVDTFDKPGGALCDHWSPGKLSDFLRSVRSSGLYVALAGGLTRDAIAQLPHELVDMAAVRGAACDGPRGANVCRERVADLVRTLSAETTAGCARGVRIVNSRP
jgi:uncharacterized protein (UPF0264 family)